ncbi:adenylate kinase [bacterium]|nr:adenylate kinase [bacterium]
MKRIIVIGPSGAGKSEFSRKLQKILNLPLYHLDNIFWKEDKTHISRDEFDKQLSIILKQDEWIIDGDYSRTYEMRMNASDTIIFLNYPIELCLKSAESRVGKERSDIPWVEEEFDPEFREWIINWFKDKLPKTKTLLEEYKNKKTIIEFKTREDADIFLKNLIL